MRFLKTKILLARKALEKVQAGSEPSKLTFSQEELEPEQQEPELIKFPSQEETEQEKIQLDRKRSAIEKCADTKNISINYGRAMVAFAISQLAKPYLKTYFGPESSSLISKFITFMSQVKYNIKSINSLRCLLLVEETDNQKTVTFKRAFQWICQIFIKYFSVNWIMHGKIIHKLTYLKYRSKMLRRVQNPEFFTYIRKTPKNQK